MAGGARDDDRPDGGGSAPAERRAQPPRSAPQDPLDIEPTLAQQDELTGLLNRRCLNEILRDRWPDVVAYHGRVTLLLIDLDAFKQINDTWGHLVGDEVLKTAAKLLKRHFRDRDRVVRFGGDEFVVILPGAGADDAALLAERAREAMAAEPLAKGDGELIPSHVSFSMGIASCPDEAEDGEELLELADKRLYAEKRARRGAVAPSPPPRRRGPARLAAGFGVLAVLSALALYVALVREPGGRGASTVSAPVSPASPTQVPDEDRAELERHVQALEAQVEGLLETLDGSRPSAREQALEATIRDLQERIQLIQERVDAPPPGPSLADAPDSAAQASVRTTQEQPLVSRPGPELLPRASDPTGPAETPPVPGAGARPELGTARGPGAHEPAVLTRPILIRRPKVQYPRVAMRLRREAEVRMRVVVDAQGRPVEAEVLEPVGVEFERAARDAVLLAQYRPGTRNGVPERMETVITIHFRLGGTGH